MIAIVDIAGQQFKVAKDQKFYVNRLKGEAGSVVEFNEVLLLDNEGTVTIGTPLVEGAKVSATILAHLRGDKVKIFKKKRRKGYQKESGHRQNLTQVKIEAINA
jgi:large subunit ribosomal protein L21